MSDTIVVGLTDAPVAPRARDWAAQRAVDRGQRLRLVSVVGGAVGAVGEDAIVHDIVVATEGRLAEEASLLRARGIEVDVSVQRGNPVDVLLEASKDAALLVIGSDYRGPAAGPARGAHGIRIAASASCPVVVVPDLDVDGRTGIVVGVDGSPISENAVRFAASEADRLGEPLIAVSVWTPLETPRNMGSYPEAYLSNLEQLTHETLALALAGLRSDFPDLEIVERVERGYPSAVINDLAQHARLAVLGTHGRGAIKRFFLGSISHEVLARLATVTAIIR